MFIRLFKSCCILTLMFRSCNLIFFYKAYENVHWLFSIFDLSQISNYKEGTGHRMQEACICVAAWNRINFSIFFDQCPLNDA